MQRLAQQLPDRRSMRASSASINDDLSNKGLENTQSKIGGSVMQELGGLARLLNQPYVTYFPSIGRNVTVKAALMLGHSLYLTRLLAETRPDREGWFWKSREQWFEATGLSIFEQSSARDELLKAGLIEQMRAGMPARLYYRINLSALGQNLLGSTQNTLEWSWEEQVVKRLLGRPIAFHVPCARLLGSVANGLYLSALLTDLRRQAQSGLLLPNGFAPARSMPQWNGLGLGDKACRSARGLLEQLGVLETQREAKLYGRLLQRIDLTQLASLLDDVQKTAPSQSGAPLLPKLHNKMLEKGKRTYARTAQQDVEKGQEYLCQNSTTRSAVLAEHLYGAIKHTERLLPTTVNKKNSATQADDEVVVVSSKNSFKQKELELVSPIDLIFPKAMNELEQRFALDLLKNHPEGQLLLDEVAGRMQSANGVRSPLGLLKTLVVAHSKNDFMPSLAARVQRQREADALRVTEARSPKQEVAIASPDVSRQRISELKQLLAGRAKT